MSVQYDQTGCHSVAVQVHLLQNAILNIKCTHVAVPRHPVPVAAEAVEAPQVFHGDGEVVD